MLKGQDGQTLFVMRSRGKGKTRHHFLCVYHSVIRYTDSLLGVNPRPSPPQEMWGTAGLDTQPGGRVREGFLPVA